MAQRLTNYLLTYRKRAGLTQGEMAFLLGTTSGTRVSRYERFGREPGLQTALAYEIICTTTQQDLFAGLYERIEDGVRQRASALVKCLEGRSMNRGTLQKLEVLRTIISRNN